MTYDSLDSVIKWADTEYFLKHDLHFGPTYTLDYLTPNTIEFLLCADWTSDLENYDSVIIRNGLQDVHMTHANQFKNGRLLQETFLGLDFFFLSHFFWTGTRELDLSVAASSLPRPMPWDGQRRLGDLISDIRAHAPALLLGIHVRSALIFEYMDTYHYTRGRPTRCTGEEEAAAARRTRSRTTSASPPASSRSSHVMFVVLG